MEYETRLLEAKELIYYNKLEEAEQILSSFDSSGLSETNLGLFYLTSGFLHHEQGNRNTALEHLSLASRLINRLEDAYLTAELNLINGFIFEELVLRSEASNSYFLAYEYYKNKSIDDKLFYTLLGIARTSPGGEEYLKEASAILDQLSSNRFYVLYFNAKAALLTDVRERNELILKSLQYFDEDYDLKKQILIYAGIALNYQLLDKADSASYYLNTAQNLVDKCNISPERILHYYIIKAYNESINKQYDGALETLDILFENGTNEPGILSQAFLRRSLIMKNLGKYEEAYYDLKKYSRLSDEEHARNEKYQLSLLSIRYQLQQKELQLTMVRLKWLMTTVAAILTLIILWIVFWFSRKKLAQKKKALEIKYKKIHKLLNEQVEESMKGKQFKKHSQSSERKSALDSELKLQEFGAVFRIHHPLFREKLSKVHPELTINDHKHCDCILAGMTVFQTTKILGVSQGAVKKARKKIRRHFRCGSIKEIFQYLQTIDES